MKPLFRQWAFLALLLLPRGPSVFGVDYSTAVQPLLKESCWQCHGATQQKGGLRLDTARQALQGGATGPALAPLHSAQSLIIRVLRGDHASLPRMPYKKPPLSESQIALLAEWIDEGAAAPSDEAPEQRRHWSLVAPVRPDVPRVKNETARLSPIDAFIQARLDGEGIKPSPEAGRRALLRRLSLDLIGLPPTPAEFEAFLADPRPDAWEQQVERLLGSPHYGERWARWWLDAARYADSNGYSIDAPRQIWKYRDWVVAALNRDEPFDQFATDQLAGDLLPGATLAQKIATGFNRNTQINQEGGIDPEQFRIESVMDRVNTFGTVFLGLTIGCAQCHDHKFDPLTQRDYYQLFAFFNNSEEEGHGKAAPSGMLEIPGEFEPLNEKDLEEAGAELNRHLNTKGSAVIKWEKELTAEQRARLSAGARASLEKPWSERTLEQKRNSYRAFKPDDPEFKSRDANLDKLEKRRPKPVTTLVMRELPEPRESHIFIKGDFTRPSERVTPGVPAALHKLDGRPGRALNRLDLARWVVAPENPLLARVIVNRLWQQYFGRGLVETENDFGTQGAPPTHPELLDWLAVEFMRPSEPGVEPWSLKHIHRLIVRSAVYRRSSQARPDLEVADPNNRLLARQSRLRLDAEAIRDSALATSGLLAPVLGGPPVFPPQPDGVMSLGQVKRDWKESSGQDRYRRALYTHWWRATPHPALSVFDSADGFTSCTRRIRSNTPLQALTLLNDKQFFEFAEALARKIDSASHDSATRIEQAFRLCLGRPPSAVEQARLLALLSTEMDQPSLMLARVLLNLDETITRE